MVLVLMLIYLKARIKSIIITDNVNGTGYFFTETRLKDFLSQYSKEQREKDAELYYNQTKRKMKKNFFSEQPDIKVIEKMATAQIKDLIMWAECEIHDYVLYIEMLKDELRKRKNKKLRRKTAYKLKHY